ncbi:MAG: anaerobic sulfite reductase subunit AsrA [Sarcina sp.]
MGYKLNKTSVNDVFEELKKSYKIYAPKRFKKEGRYSDTDIIKYAQVDKIEDIVFDVKSTYPAKEVVSPINQTLYFFNEDEFKECKLGHDKDILIFARPCDINAQERQDKIFLENGNFKDEFYERVRNRVKFVCIECTKGFDTCLCVSMQANKTDNYSLALRVCDDDEFLFNVKDQNFAPYFSDCTPENFELKFIEKNDLTIDIPKIENKEILEKLKKHKMWEEFNKRCISCGRCTITCSTCSCFTTTDITYSDNRNLGERKRTAASCQIPGFDVMAGGHGFRNTTGDRMRYKILHKIHDYKETFKSHDMCVGCGRCTDNCPENIAYHETINKVNEALKEIKEGLKDE